MIDNLLHECEVVLEEDCVLGDVLGGDAATVTTKNGP